MTVVAALVNIFAEKVNVVEEQLWVVPAGETLVSMLTTPGAGVGVIVGVAIGVLVGFGVQVGSNFLVGVGVAVSVGEGSIVPDVPGGDVGVGAAVPGPCDLPNQYAPPPIRRRAMTARTIISVFLFMSVIYLTSEYYTATYPEMQTNMYNPDYVDVVARLCA